MQIAVKKSRMKVNVRKPVKFTQVAELKCPYLKWHGAR